jgi:hypothetical protein
LWRNKGALAVTAVAATFIANPEPYLNGTKELAGAVVSQVARPLAEVPVVMAKEGGAEFARNTNGTVVLVTAIGALTLLVGWGFFRRGCLPQSLPAPAPPAAPMMPASVPVGHGANGATLLQQ